MSHSLENIILGRQYIQIIDRVIKQFNQTGQISGFYSIDKHHNNIYLTVHDNLIVNDEGNPRLSISYNHNQIHRNDKSKCLTIKYSLDYGYELDPYNITGIISLKQRKSIHKIFEYINANILR